MSRRVLILLFSIVALGFSSCKEDDRSSLTVEERKEVNQLYKSRLDSLNKALTQECKDLRKNRFDKIVDSLKQSRLEEINLIMKKEQK